MQLATRTVGDRLTALTETLRVEAANGSIALLNLQGCTVLFRMIAEDGTVVVDDVPAEVVIATQGKVSYEFEVGDVDTAGLFFYWWIVVNADGLRIRIPIGGRRAQLRLVPAE